ncbi:MAG: 3-deoxy-manno-octulosonate cytidylyltransferase [Planctomycetes bacterium]|nr:3-deoxy-manno-octulosonate cytidylyltransferase [Planctomycetota bacterium]
MRTVGSDAASGIHGLSAAAVIPARIGSTRLPRKMMLAETGTPLFVHTARAVAACPRIARVVVATDSSEILDAAVEHGVEARMTRPDHQSGTDRVHECVEGLRAEDGARFDVVLNVQGDEPDIAPEDLAALVDCFADDAVELASLWAPIESEAELAARSVVKLVLGSNGDALYFSRAPIPDTSHARSDSGEALARRHIGVYAFRPDALARFCALPHGVLERAENLEQLRWLEAGGRLRVLPASRRPRGIDTAEEYADFVRRTAPSSDPKSARS